MCNLFLFYYSEGMLQLGDLVAPDVVPFLYSVAPCPFFIKLRGTHDLVGGSHQEA